MDHVTRQHVLLLIFLLPPVLLTWSVDKGRRGSMSWRAHWDHVHYPRTTPKPPEPSFESKGNYSLTNITVQLGGTAFLHCRVLNLGERAISWIRRRDWHILTSGMVTFTNDERFQVLHSDDGNDWTLQIKYVQKRDSGTYECQVTTGIGLLSLFVNIHVVVPEAFILGNGEYHVDKGSTINLVCIIEKSPTPPQYVFWYHYDRMINYDNHRGIEVSTEPGAKTHSRLTIQNAQYSDSGNYSCIAANAEPASIYVFVSEGDKIAAIQRRKTSSVGRIAKLSLWTLLVLSVFIMR